MFSSRCPAAFSVLFFVALLATVPLAELVHGAAFDSYDKGPCLEQCCCQVCSSRQAPAWPYGVMNQPASANPANPYVIGAACHVPVWSDSGFVNDTSSNPVFPPATILWQSLAVFGELDYHQSPMSCSCCRVSVDTSCSEDIPVATAPKSFRYVSGTSIDGNAGQLDLVEGFALSTADIIELRNNTWCGYDAPGYEMRSTAPEMTIAGDAASVVWSIATLPPNGCYRMCYYHSGLTTPGWYYVGDVVVNAVPAGSMSYSLGAHDSLLTGNDVTLTFTGSSLVSVFDDAAELRTAGNCGDSVPAPEATTTLSTLYGKLDVEAGTAWCLPPLPRRYTTIRPVQLIEPQYGDCPVADRIYLDKLQWAVTLPAGGTYTVCYRRDTTWHTLAGAITVPNQNTAAVGLDALYTAMDGANWKYKENWGGGSPCTWFGIRCNAANQVTGIFLTGNNLVGTLPTAFFQAEYFNTLEDLKLDMNDITGSIPSDIGLFRKLKHLDLGFNSGLTGSLPSTLLQTSLQTIYVSNTGLTGNIPHELTLIGQQWFNMTTLFAPPAPNYPPACPTHDLICSDKGSTDVGVSQCGNTGITEEECLVQGCCFNLQAPLTFGGTACFTKKPSRAAEFPQCTATSCTKLTV